MKRLIDALNAPSSLVHWITAAAFLAVAVFARVLCFQGYADWDARHYAELADHLAHGSHQIGVYEGPPVFAIRVGVYGPTAGVIALFGLSEVTITLYPFLVSIAACVLAYGVARGFGGGLSGLVALALAAVLPIDLPMASVLYPDAIAAFWANVGVALAVLAFTQASRSRVTLFGGLAGLSFGSSWLCKESVVFLVPLVAVLPLLGLGGSRRNRVAAFVAIGLASGLVLVAEAAFYYHLTGDLLFRFHETERNYKVCAAYFFTQSSPFYGWEEGEYLTALRKRLLVDGPKQLLLVPGMLFLPSLACCAVVYGGVFRRRSFLVPALWLVSLLLMFNFMTSSFRSYLPLPLFSRYVYPILLPSIVLVSQFVSALLTGGENEDVSRTRRLCGVALVALLCILIVPNVWETTWFRSESLSRQVAAQLGPEDVIYSDYRSVQNLVFFRTQTLSPTSPTTIPFETVQQSDMPVGAYVLVNRAMLDHLQQVYKYRSPDFVDTPSPGWEKVWSNGQAVLYRISKRTG